MKKKLKQKQNTFKPPILWKCLGFLHRKTEIFQLQGGKQLYPRNRNLIKTWFLRLLIIQDHVCIWTSESEERKRRKCTSWARVNHKVLPQQGPTQFRLSAHPVTMYTRKVSSFPTHLRFGFFKVVHSSSLKWYSCESSLRFPHIYWPQLFFLSGRWPVSIETKYRLWHKKQYRSKNILLVKNPQYHSN